LLQDGPIARGTFFFFEKISKSAKQTKQKRSSLEEALFINLFIFFEKSIT